MLPELSVDDFIQECCVCIFLNLDKMSLFSDEHHFVSSMISGQASRYYLTENNIKNSRYTHWNIYRNEVKWDFTESEPPIVKSEPDSIDIDITRLDDREQGIINLFLEGNTHQEIGDKLKISKQRVHQIFKKSLDKCRIGED